ncbi:unnamed protein product [Rotaria sp. Silwood1]|nr:unnamed protein product [Rotaria sp. Silwood1]
MLNNYTFLTDHSYSLRPISDDNDDLPLNQRERKTKKHRRSSNHTNETISTTNRTVSIDRSSSDKENNSLILLNSNDIPISLPTTSININTRTNKSHRTRLSTRTFMTNSRLQLGKKQDNKISSKTVIKSTQGNKKKKSINRNKTKLSNISLMDSIDILPSLSIEERVKLRRTKPIQSTTTTTTIIEEIKPRKINKISLKKPKISSINKNKKIISWFRHFDDHKKDYIQRLSDAVSIPSVSAWPDNRPEVVRMVQWTKSLLEKLGAKVELADIGEQKLADGTKIKLPDVILATYGNDKTKKTVCIYGHLDVQPAQISDGWDTEPFILTEKDGKLFGRGSTDDKGPVLSWLNVIEAYQKLNQSFPVNIKFVLESMEEYGSEGLEDLLKSLKNTFLSDVDYVVISDSYWLGKEKPCLQYGLRGICYFFIDVECSTKDLHSGCFGGTVHEAMTDLIAIMSTLVDSQGHILIDGMYDDVAPLLPEEEQLYSPITFDMSAYCSEAGVRRTIQNEKEKILMHRWRYPSLSLHGIQGAFDGCGCKTVIPRHVIGKFSIRIVPNMKIATVEKLVEEHVKKIMKTRNSPNKVSIKLEHGGNYWVADPNNSQYVAARKATVAVHGMEPDLTREGGSIPITLTFQEQTGKSVLLLPIGASDDGAHSQNEKFDISNYMNGMKVMSVYFQEIAKL